MENQYSGMANFVDEEDRIASILEKAPKEYASMLANIKSKYVIRYQ